MVATHLKRETQVWRLLGAITLSGVVVATYGAIQFYGLDPLAIRTSGPGAISTLGNPIFAGTFLLMVVPVVIARVLKSNGAPASPFSTIPWVIPITIIVLGMAFTAARGPWVGLAAELILILALLGMAIGWRASWRALSLSAAALAPTWAVMTFVPAPKGGVDLAPQAFSAGSAVISSLSPTTEFPESEHQEVTAKDLTPPSSMKTRLILWKGSSRMALDRPLVPARGKTPTHLPALVCLWP